jgi:hypothetical protein
VKVSTKIGTINLLDTTIIVLINPTQSVINWKVKPTQSFVAPAPKYYLTWSIVNQKVKPAWSIAAPAAINKENLMKHCCPTSHE